jgi:hypothetical protein
MTEGPAPDAGEDYVEEELPAGKPAEELREDVADGDASSPGEEETE